MRAAAADTENLETNLMPKDLSLWTESMLWDKEISVYSGLGYNNNVLLSADHPNGGADHPQGSAYFLNGLDALATRLPLDGWKVVAALTGSDTRYWRNVGASGEDLALSSIRVERDFSGGWIAGLEGRGIYENQVLDVTTSSGVPTTALVQGYGFAGRPSLRKNLSASLWLQLEVPVAWWSFKLPLDDYWETGPIITAGYDVSPQTDVSLSYSATYELHDSWQALNSTGLKSLDKRLELFYDKVEFDWHHYWDAERCWRSSTRLLFTYREDNGGGFFNFDQYQFVEDLRWSTADWEIKGSGQVAYENYPIQNDGAFNGVTLQRTLLNFSLNIQRRLYKELKCFAQTEYQQALSNEVGGAGDYNGISAAGGLRLEF